MMGTLLIGQKHIAEAHVGIKYLKTERGITIDNNKQWFVLTHGDNTSSHPNYKFTLWMGKREIK